MANRSLPSSLHFMEGGSWVVLLLLWPEKESPGEGLFLFISVHVITSRVNKKYRMYNLVLLLLLLSVVFFSRAERAGVGTLPAWTRRGREGDDLLLKFSSVCRTFGLFSCTR